MPNHQEKIVIAKNTSWTVDGLNRVLGTNLKLTDKECRDLLETTATRTGEPNNWPNIFWALEREMDARIVELLGGAATDPQDRKRASAELRGLAIAYSIKTGISIEDATMSAMKRWQDANA